MDFQSLELGELAKALVQAQSEMENVKKGAENPFFKSKYADLASVREASIDILNKHGLCIIQTMGNGDGKVKVITTLLHSSGQFIRGELGMVPAKNDPQAIGSVISYFRRYSWQAIIGLSAEDDDANSATAQPANQKPIVSRPVATKAPQKAPQAKKASDGSITLCPEKVGQKEGKKSNGSTFVRTFFKSGEAWYSTFNLDHGSMLLEASESGRQVEISYSAGEKGMDIETVVFVDEPPQQREPGEDMEEAAF
jgi:hypothetical protein